MSYITASFFELFVTSSYSGSIQHALACTIMHMHNSGHVFISHNARVYSVTWGAICFLCAVGESQSEFKLFVKWAVMVLC